MPQEGFLLTVDLNPLRFFCLENPSDDLELVLTELSRVPYGEFSVDILRQRYNEMTEPTQLFAFPNLPAIVEKIVTPLRHAKAAYILGNYLGCVALCGMVAEMTAILTYEVRCFQVNGKIPDEQTQRRLFGSSFERLGQERRIDVLFATGLISEAEKVNFATVKELRRKYLHFLSQPHANVKEDSREAFMATANSVGDFLGIRPGPGGVMHIDQRLLNYLAAHGLLKGPEEEPPI